MEITRENHKEWAVLAMLAARDAAKKILEIYSLPFDAIAKEDGSPVTLADMASNEILVNALKTTHLPILSEELEHQAYNERKYWSHFWCIDPLDGTKEFIKKNDQFAINIALISNEIPVLGIIADPVNEVFILGGIYHEPTFVHFNQIENDKVWQKIDTKTHQNDPVVVASSYAPMNSKNNDFLEKLNERFGDFQSIYRGSALKFFDLALGRADVYPRFAPTMEWDIAAGHAILNAQNGTILNASTLKPLIYNKEDLRNPSFVAVTAPLIEAIQHEVLV